MLYKSVVNVLLVSMSIFLGSSLAIAAVKDQVSSRTEPVGSLCMAGEECASAPVVVAAGPRSGETVYTTKCIACHGSGAAGAPKFGDAGAWSARVAQGADTLYANAINGVRGMPAKGLCMDCSDDEIKAAVDHMVDNSK